MPALRRKLPSVAAASMVGMTGIPGQNSAVSFSTARMISGFSGDAALSTGVPVGVTEIWSSASTRTSVF